MITKVIVPKLGETMEEGVIGKWVKKEGDRVEKGEVVFELSTDKASFEVEAPKSGLLRKILYPEGATVKVIEPVAYIADSMDESLPVEQKKDIISGTETEIAADSSPVTSGTVSPKLETVGGRIFVSPIARKLAAEKGLDLSQIKGTGPGGRIVEKDILNFTPFSGVVPAVQAPNASSQLPDGCKVIPLSNMRKIIAQRLQKSVQEAPHFYLQMDVDMTEANKLRDKSKESSEKSSNAISFNDMVIYAVSRSLKKFELFNSHFVNNEIRQFADVNIGVAVALEGGLIVPVLKKADSKSVAEIAKASKELVAKAKEGKLTPEDLAGGTFTISNMGMMHVDMFTAIINPPQVGILAVGAMKMTPVFVGSEIIPRMIMKMTVSSDHSAIDGAYAAKFLFSVKDILEKIKFNM